MREKTRLAYRSETTSNNSNGNHKGISYGRNQRGTTPSVNSGEAIPIEGTSEGPTPTGAHRNNNKKIQHGMLEK